MTEAKRGTVIDNYESDTSSRRGSLASLMKNEMRMCGEAKYQRAASNDASRP